MHPELFKIPFTELTVKSYGFMLVIGFLAAIFLVRKLSKGLGHNPEHITNAALYAILTGIIGSRIFYVIQFWDENFKQNPIEVFYIWEGGLVLLGGIIPAIAVIIWYLWSKKLPIRQYMDILAVALTLTLAFGRIGCLLNGCCYGKPAELPWSVRFPYGSIPYSSQAKPDLERNRPDPQLNLPDNYYFQFFDDQGTPRSMLLPENKLTDQQKHFLIEHDLHRCLPVHPTQVYSSLFNGFLLFVILFFFWKRGIKLEKENKFSAIHKPGTTFALMFILYGTGRFIVEFFRDDNPYEVAALTISQLIGIGMVITGIGFFAVFTSLKSDQQIKT